MSSMSQKPSPEALSPSKPTASPAAVRAASDPTEQSTWPLYADLWFTHAVIFRGLCHLVFWCFPDSYWTKRIPLLFEFAFGLLGWIILLKCFFMRSAKLDVDQRLGSKWLTAFVLGASAAIPLLYLQKDMELDDDQVSRTLNLWSGSFTIVGAMANWFKYKELCKQLWDDCCQGYVQAKSCVRADQCASDEKDEVGLSPVAKQ
ncbi:uncharacterized protein SPPG_05622 [Spizellomyces punctatus DAOM BR117]|uniref:Uncharacterized protein n=1 Tax=Spizellomyces punctatus (strain DAOM BR117) TaxID=645134 RepID=A0A0L0HF23_SPIPD|nr:uncharacterized protein SPPG_05622 [Spizellomyces punctatus DAOM BR117]KNC99378.1 hypothetical protein SPPG_05622 [Spizellomyces punctatus DAOM BR117]|eukprot:XP_016607418.1 hypothetical protein SPPG_05622 [Spizellomyces punctatus DAOM BR117]